MTCIASTTHIDLHNERMTKGALVGMAKQIKERFIPQLIEHDPGRCVGVALYGEVFQLTDGEYALGIVSGVFENNTEKKLFKTGKINNVWKDFKNYLDINDLMAISSQNIQTKQNYSFTKEPNVADLLETHLDSTQVLPDGTVYKIKRFIANVGDLKIEIYPKDHRPKHFHVVSKQRIINARFDIETLDLIDTKQGDIKNKDIKKIQNFFKTKPSMLEKLKKENARIAE